MSGVADRVRRTSMWSGLNTVILRLVNIVIMAVVARILSPEDFGVFALCLVAFGVIQALGDLGVSAAISRRDLDLDEFAPTVTTIAWLTGAVLAVLLFVFADPVAALLGSGDVAGPLRIMSVCVLVGGGFSVPANQLQREFRGDLVFRANMVSFVFSTVALVSLAAVGGGAMAFAVSRAVGILVAGVMLFASVPVRYRPGFSPAVAKYLLRFGLPIALSSLLAQAVTNVDFVLIGHLLDVHHVGLYNLAFNVSTWSTAVLAATLSSVVLPAFSDVLGGGGDPHRAMRRAVEATLVLALPIATVTGVLATPLVVTVYGEKWSAAGPVLAVLSVYGAVSVIGLLLSDVLIAAGRTAILAAVQAGALVLLIPAMLFGIEAFGIEGAGLAHVAVIVLATLPFYLLAIRKAIGSSPLDVLRSAALPVVASAIAGVAGWSVLLLPWPAPVHLVVGGLVIGIVYVLVAAPALSRLLPDDGALRVRRLLVVAGRPAASVSRRVLRVRAADR